MKKKVLLLSGGISKERLISLDTGLQVAKELRKNFYKVKISEPSINFESTIKQFKPDLIFNASEVSGLGSTVITWDEFNLSKPTFPFIISLEDEITLEIEFLAYIY